MDNKLKISIDSKDLPELIKAISKMSCQQIILVGVFIVAIILAFKF